MMMNFNAMERNAEEIRALTNDAGLHLKKIWFQNETLGISGCVRRG